MSFFSRTFFVGTATGILLGAVLGLFWISPAPAKTQANVAPLNRAVLAVKFGNGSTSQACVRFSEPSITGYDLLRRSGFDVVVSEANSVGAAVCMINQEGCDVRKGEDCFCKSYTEQKYWVYWLWQDTQWKYSNKGMGNTQVISGSVQGWTWGKGEADGGAGNVDIESVCAISTITAVAPTAVANSVVGGGATNTPAPTQIETPTLLPSPNAQPHASTPAAMKPTTDTAVQQVQAQVIAPTATAGTTATAAATATSEPTTTTESTLNPISNAATPTPENTPTPIPTIAPSPTALPPTATPSPSVLPSSPTPAATTEIAAATPTSKNEEASTNPRSNWAYIVFGIMALGLAGGVVFMRRR